MYSELKFDLFFKCHVYHHGENCFYNHRDILGIELNLFFKDKIIKSWKKKLLLNNR